MTNQVDLNRLREALTRNQSSSETENSNIPKNEKVYVTPEGKLVMGEGAGGANRTLSEVPQTVFAG